MTEFVKSELNGGILQLSLNRPHKKNALTRDMYAALAAALERVASDRSIKVVHLSGVGDAFTAGNDLADFVDPVALDGDPPVHQFLRALPNVEVPVVAAVNGLAVGVGVTLLLHCDFVFAAADAVLSSPFVDLGLVTEVVDRDVLLQKSLATAAVLAAKPPSALRATKRLLRRQDEPLPERMQLELELFASSLQSPEAEEAMSAFFEKREPDFSRFE